MDLVPFSSESMQTSLARDPHVDYPLHEDPPLLTPNPALDTFILLNQHCLKEHTINLYLSSLCDFILFCHICPQAI